MAFGHPGAQEFGGFAVGCGDPGGVDAQGGRPSAARTEATCDRAEIHPRAEQLGRECRSAWRWVSMPRRSAMRW